MKSLERLVYPELSYKITGVLFAAHNELGKFCNENQYGDFLDAYFKKLGIKYEREKILPPMFKDEVKGRNRIDFLIEDKIILEVKNKRFIEREDYYQVRRYLRALNKKLGIIVNFRDKYLKPKRILNSQAKV
jgi:GxxExxY protein